MEPKHRGAFVISALEVTGAATLAIERDDEEQAEAWVSKSRDVQKTTGWTSDTFLVLPFLA